MVLYKKFRKEGKTMYRTHNLGELNIKNVGGKVELSRLGKKNKKPWRYGIY